MKIKIITLSSVRENACLSKLIGDMQCGGFDHEVVYKDLCEGGVVPNVEQWCRENVDNYDYVIHIDGWDSVVLGTNEELIRKFPADIKYFGSAEKGIFPDSSLEPLYPQTPHAWRFVNGGHYAWNVKFFVELCNRNPPKGHNDQLWMSKFYLDEKSEQITLDYNCEIFQSCAFEAPDEYAITRDHRLLNRKTGSLPIFLHFNGRTEMSWALHI